MATIEPLGAEANIEVSEAVYLAFVSNWKTRAIERNDAGSGCEYLILLASGTDEVIGRIRYSGMKERPTRTWFVAPKVSTPMDAPGNDDEIKQAVDRIDPSDWAILKLANEKGKFALDLGYGPPEMQHAFNRGIDNEWWRFVDLSPLPYGGERDKLFRIFKLTTAGLRRRNDLLLKGFK